MYAANVTSIGMEIVGDRPRRWLAEPDPWMHGYYSFDWWDM